MDKQLIELYVKRGRLRERISAQRGELARELVPVSHALQSVDRGAQRLRQARAWAAQHPTLITAAIVAVVVMRPRMLWRVARRAFSLWRNWSQVKEWTRLGMRVL